MYAVLFILHVFALVWFKISNDAVKELEPKWDRYYLELEMAKQHRSYSFTMFFGLLLIDVYVLKLLI